MERIPVVYSDHFLTDYRTVDCESPDRVAAIHFLVQDMAEFIEPEPCTIADLKRCHTERLIRMVKQDEEIYDTAIRAAGGAIRAAEIALERPSFALVRPPGHHAGNNFNGGFCFFNNVAVALYNLLYRGLISNALIVDIDLHYGNGTYDIVGGDQRIGFRNIDAYSRAEFLRYFDDALEDAGTFDLVVCSAGFDTYVRDWGGLLLTEDYAAIASRFLEANRRTVTVLEGGYYIEDLGKNVRAYFQGILKACS